MNYLNKIPHPKKGTFHIQLRLILKGSFGQLLISTLNSMGKE